jgi:plasmid stabilization system protein ParE
MRVVWTKSALASLQYIYQYYKRNVSITIALNIRELILTASLQLESFPSSGQLEEILNETKYTFRYIIRGRYKIIYTILKDKVFITDIFDTRQDPDKIKERNK